MKVDKRTLSLPAAQGVRLVALELLDEAEKTAATLRTTPMLEPLHDVRVALRRARSWLRAFRDDLGDTVRRKDRRALREIAAGTSLGRDIDVQREWLSTMSTKWGGKRRKGADWLSEYLALRQREAGNPLDEELMRKFSTVHSALVERLSTFTLPVRATRVPPSLGAAIAAHVGPQSDAVGLALDEVRSVDDETPAHKARIAAKRLRYLIEPAAPLVKRGGALVTALKSLQDELGALRDAHVIGHVLRDAAESFAATQPAVSASSRTRRRRIKGRLNVRDVPREALLAVGEAIRQDAEEAFARVEKHWLDGQYSRLNRDVASFAKRLAAMAR